MNAPQPPGKFVPHITLSEGWTYFEPADSEYIIGFKPVVMKLMRLQTPDGKPASNDDGTPSYTWQATNISRTLTRAEYEVQKTMEDRKR